LTISADFLQQTLIYFQTLNATKYEVVIFFINSSKLISLQINEDSLRHQGFIILLQRFGKINKQ